MFVNIFVNNLLNNNFNKRCPKSQAGSCSSCVKDNSILVQSSYYSINGGKVDLINQLPACASPFLFMTEATSMTMPSINRGVRIRTFSTPKEHTQKGPLKDISDVEKENLSINIHLQSSR